MTGFHLSIGYISGYTCSMSKAEAFEEMLKVVREIRNNPVACLYYLPREKDSGMHEEVVEANYRSDGPALRVLEDSVMLCCSGGGEYRGVKEECAMCVARLMMDRLNSLGIPVNVLVS